MSDEGFAARQDIRRQFIAFKQMMLDKTEQILAAAERYRENRNTVEKRLDEFDREIAQLKTRVSKLENPASDAA